MSSEFPSDAQFLDSLLTEASRAPSVHNVQNARWSFIEEEVQLWADNSARLPVADPTGHDDRLSLGCAWEGMALAGLRRGWRLSAPDFVENWGDPPSKSCAGTRLMARGRWIPDRPNAAETHLLEWVWKRRCHRGNFRSPALDQARLWHEGLTRLSFRFQSLHGKDLKWLNSLGDSAAAELFRETGYPEELRHWLKLNPAEEGYHEWGLNREVLGLNAWEAKAVEIAFRPSVMQRIRVSPLISVLSAEAPKANSAWAVLLLYAPLDEDPFETGRRQYRFWLELAALGLCTWPLSAAVDVPSARKQLEAKFLTPPGQRLLNAVRVGSPDQEKGPTCRRTPRSLWRRSEL